MSETFSFYKGGIWVTTPSGEMDVPELINRIKSDKYKAVINQLRALKTKEKQREFKRTNSSMDYVTIGGIFSTRGKQKVTNPSGLACHDIDDVKDAKKVKNKLTENQYVLACFISPSGNGVKVIVKIPIDDNYDGYFMGFAKEIGIDPKHIDKSTRDISRACFMSWDPEAYYNQNSSVWTTSISENPEVMWEDIELSRDTSRSGYEFREIVRLLREGKKCSDIKRIASNEHVKWDKWNSWEKWNQEGMHYQEETFKKAMDYVQKHPVTQQKALQTTFPTVCLPDALRDYKPKEWLIKGLIPKRGIVYIGGAPKAYKSTIAFHLALCLSTKKRFLGHFEIESKKDLKVLFIQEENDEDMLHKMRLLSRGMEWEGEEDINNLRNIHLSLCNGITIDTYGGRADMAIARLSEKIEEIEPDVIFFDSAVRVIEGDENKASDVKRVHSTLKKVCEGRDILTCIIHHTSKALKDLRGSIDFAAQADTVVMLSSKPTYNGLVYATIPFNRGAPPDINKFNFRVYSIDENKKRLKGSFDIDRIDAMVIDEYDEDRIDTDEDKKEVWMWITETNNRKPFSRKRIEIELLPNVPFKSRKLFNILQAMVEEGKLTIEGKTSAARYVVVDETQEKLEVEEEDVI